MRSKGDYQLKNLGSADGWAEFSAVVKGDVGGKVGVRAPDYVELPSFADLISSQDVWKNLKWNGDGQFRLEGLEEGDKKGLYPLGGVVLAACPAGVCPVTFKSNLPDYLVRMYSYAPAVVLWVYIDMSGNISFSGETGLRIGGYHYEQGYEFKAVRSKLEATRINIAEPTGVQWYGNGSIDAAQQAGISLAADVLVGGIRPAAVKVFVGGRVGARLNGELAYSFIPDTGWAGNGCVDSSVWVGAQLDANFRLKAELPIFKKWDINEIIERSYSGQTDFYVNDFGSKCLASGPFAIAAAVQGVDPDNTDNALVNIDFSPAYNNVNVRNLTEKWVVSADCVLCPTRQFEIPSFKAGLDVISLPVDRDYTLTLQALKGTALEGTMLEGMTVVKETTTSLHVGDKPFANFDVSYNDGNCANLKLTADASATSGRTIDEYTWYVRRTGSTIQTYSGNPASPVMLPSCGETSINLAVTDSAGFVTAVGRTIDTTEMAPKVTLVEPTNLTLNQPGAVTVSGQNLPLTAILNLADATCDPPINRSSTGFSQICTATAVGDKTMTIQTDTTANGGSVIDSSYRITVSKPPEVVPTSGRLNDTGIVLFANGTANNLASEPADFPGQDAAYGRDAQARAGTLVKVGGGVAGFDFTKLDSNGTPLANQSATYAANPWSCVRDNYTGLIWEVKSDDGGLRDKDNTYSWYNANPATNGGSAGTENGGNCSGGIGCDTAAYVAAVNAAGLCGYSDWRLPQVEELRSIIYYAVAYSRSTIDTDYFPNARPPGFWSASPFAGNPAFAWLVGFYNGGAVANNKGTSYDIRLVRDGQ